MAPCASPKTQSGGATPKSCSVLSLQSEVVYGHVGQGAARFALQRLGQGAQHSPFFVVIAQEELPDSELDAFHGSDADQKGARPGSTGKPGGFGIEDDLAHRGFRAGISAAAAAL